MLTAVSQPPAHAFAHRVSERRILALCWVHPGCESHTDGTHEWVSDPQTLYLKKCIRKTNDDLLVSLSSLFILYNGLLKMA